MTTKVARLQAQDMIALTLKVDSKTYVRLSTLRAKERKTVQEMLTEALKSYLARAGA
jgi:predicted transcriptional regulator